MWREKALLLVILLFLTQQICGTKEKDHACAPSSCGKVTNITHPFRLKGDPPNCGDDRYELTCENNNVAVLYLYSGKYHVQAINYNNFTIRVVDPGVQETNCSSIPRHFLSRTNFTYRDVDLYDANQRRSAGSKIVTEHVFQYIVFMKCSHPLWDNRKYVDTASCVNWDSKGHSYAIAGDLLAEDIEDGCDVKLVTPTSWWGLQTNNDSYTAIFMAIVYGFEISWIHRPCEDLCVNSPYTYCHWDISGRQLQCTWDRVRDCHVYLGIIEICDDKGILYQLLSIAKETIYGVLFGLFQTIIQPRYIMLDGHYYFTLGVTIGRVLSFLWIGKFLFGVTLLIALLTYKWRKRHLSIYENIENYLEQNNLMPIRYSYKEIKKMVGGFKDKLGEGGFGSVFKGKLRSGPCVAIKVLGKSKGDGQDFISEVATIGRIHHQNIVKLIGFCVEGSKRALVYEFMSNGSLDKVLFSKDGSMRLSYDEIYNISIGVARGIAYLHHGCEMQILHFDIKPHNILLDEKFAPKISDFGLARLYPINNSIVTMAGARGTIGYMAPELFYENIGRISHKADVYSFGMLLMEMASKRKNLNPYAENSSQLYFPFWIYNHLEKEKEIEMEDVTKEENQIAKKMIIVALWCIQLKPNDRPSMNKVVEMLEGDIENLEIPPKPTLYPQETISQETILNETDSSMESAIIPLIKNSI